MSLTYQEPPIVLKAHFVKNLNQLLDILGKNRKDAAEEIKVPYKWLRRMVSSGTGRKEERNIKNLEKVVQFFRLPRTDDLWRTDLVRWLVSEKTSLDFLKTFEARLKIYYTKKMEQRESIDMALVRAIEVALVPRISNLSVDEKLLCLISTGKHDYLIELIDRQYDNSITKGDPTKEWQN